MPLPSFIRAPFSTSLLTVPNVTLSCRAGKIPYKQTCFLTSFEPNKVYLGPYRNNKGVAILLLSGRKRPDFNRLPSTCPISRTSCSTWSYPCPVIYYCDPHPSVSPDRKTSSGGGVFINVTVTLFKVKSINP